MQLFASHRELQSLPSLNNFSELNLLEQKLVKLLLESFQLPSWSDRVSLIVSKFH